MPKNLYIRFEQINLLFLTGNREYTLDFGSNTKDRIIQLSRETLDTEVNSKGSTDFRIADGKIANYSGNLTITDVGAAVGVSLSGQGQTTTTPTAEIYVMAQTTASTKNWIQVATGTATS